ncbi:unnamed protein product [Phaeothamnion confervicola]
MPLSQKQQTRPLASPEQLTFVWFLVDGATHLAVEGSYLALALGKTAAASNSYSAALWKEYGKADARWAVRDATVISLELLTVFLIGPLCFWLAWAVWHRRSYRHVLQVMRTGKGFRPPLASAISVIVCVAELYGGWMTFCPEWVDGSPNLDTSDPVHLWVYLVFMNGVWVALPALLLWESVVHITAACDVAKTEGFDDRGGGVDGGSGLPGTAWWRGAAVLLQIYAVLMPVIMLLRVGK